MVNHQLTKREREVLSLIADGRTNAEIADELHISRSTATNHTTRIFSKLGVETRTQAAITEIKGRDVS